MGSSAMEIHRETVAGIDKEKRKHEKPVPEGHLVAVSRSFSDIQAEPISWLWPRRIALGKVTIIAGHPGLGKSQLTVSIAATVSNGEEWPHPEDVRCELGSSLFLSSEDDAADTIRPRLEAAGADLQRCHILEGVRDSEGRMSIFSLVGNMDQLTSLVEGIDNLRLIVIDPISAYLSGTDTHRNSDVRSALLPLQEFAARHKIAVICVSHFSKGGGSNALLRVTGSLAFIAAARAGFVVLADPQDNDRRLFLPVKNNLSVMPPGLAFRLEPIGLDKDIETSRIVWELGIVDMTADEAMALSSDDDRGSALGEAKDFLSSLLGQGSIPSNTVKKKCVEAGLSWRTVQRASGELKIKKFKKEFQGSWSWELPKGV